MIKYREYFFLTLLLILSSHKILADDLDVFTKPITVRECTTAEQAQNKGYSGIARTNVSGASQCAASCINTAGCLGILQYDNVAPEYNCYLWGATDVCRTIGKAGTYYKRFTEDFSVKTATGETQRFIGTSTDCVQNDNTYEMVRTLDQCAINCSGKQDCTSFSHSSTDSGGRCVYKHDGTSCVLDSNGYKFFKKFGSPIPAERTTTLQTCDPNDPGCSQQVRDYPPFASDNSMLTYPRVARKGNTKVATDPSEAILAQTSYLARVMIQANDIFPPSHVSTRTSGETYLSSIMPVKYNVKTLTESSMRRSSLGSESFSITSNGKGTVDTAVRDWVEQHLGNYCDPLAAKEGIYDCIPVPSDANKVAALSKDGTTMWEQRHVNSRSKPFAADITASTLFEPKVNDAEAAMRYIYNITNNTPIPFISGQNDFSIPKEYITTYNGKTVLSGKGYNLYMNFLERQSKLSLSQYALMKIFAEHLPLESVKVPVTKWANGKKQTVFEPTSRQGLLEFESTKRFSDPAWYDRVQQMPTPALLKELAYMQALQLTLEYKRYEQQQIQIAQFASFASELSALAQMAKDMAKSADPEAAKKAINSTLSGLGLNPPAEGASAVKSAEDIQNMFK